jgi:predicted esterase
VIINLKKEYQMKKLIFLMIAATAVSLFAEENTWTPTLDPTKSKGLIDSVRKLEVYRHGIKKEWKYKVPQQDTFIVIHPKTKRENAPLYVVLHSAGHDVFSCVKCTKQVGNHDIYHSPDNFYALYVDCRANKGDWWWGGMHARDARLTKKNSGLNPMPVELRVIDTVQWVIDKYKIDSERVYLSGNSMGGSGTLGIGLRNGHIFAAIKANVPAGIEHASERMGFSHKSWLNYPDPPITIDYSAQNDGWSFGHERLVKVMNDRKYPLYFYWGPFGHANNHARIMGVNDLITSFDWLSVRKNEAYVAFTNASCNDELPWPDNKSDKSSGQVNAFFRWKIISDEPNKITLSLYLTNPTNLKTEFSIPEEATADISIRRIQKMKVAAGDALKWHYGNETGNASAKKFSKVKAGDGGLITIPKVAISVKPKILTIWK